MEKLISIIVPIYNVEDYLERCLASISKQTYKNLEIILIDDGSTDKSAEICDRFAEKDQRIVVVHKENEGVSAARNLGMRMAKGEYIGFIDSDDYIDLNMYETLYTAIENKNADLAVCGFEQVRINGQTQVNDAHENIDWSKKNIIANYFTQGIIKEIMYAPVNKLYRKSMLSDLYFNTKYRMGEDILFVFECVERMNKMVYVQGAFYHYVMRKGSAMTSSFSEKRLEYIYAIREIERICLEKYPYVQESVQIWVYRHILNTLRQIIVTKSCKQFEKFYLENKNYIARNKNKYYPKLSLNQKIDYCFIMHCHWLLRLKVKLS